jgi:hypothetical protein
MVVSKKVILSAGVTRMSARLSRLSIGLCGLLGTVLLGLYFGGGFGMGLASLPPNITQDQVVSLATQYHNTWYLGAWLQATGSLLSVIFFLGLVQRAGGTTRLAGMLTLLGSAVLLAVVLIEALFTIDLAQAALNGHGGTSLTSYDLMTVFTHIYPLAPAPLIFLALGAILVKSDVLPRIFGYLALALGSLFEVVGLLGLFTTPVLTLIPLSLQSLWLLSAGIAFLVRSETAGRVNCATGDQSIPRPSSMS